MSDYEPAWTFMAIVGICLVIAIVAASVVVGYLIP